MCIRDSGDIDDEAHAMPVFQEHVPVGDLRRVAVLDPRPRHLVVLDAARRSRALEYLLGTLAGPPAVGALLLARPEVRLPRQRHLTREVAGAQHIAALSGAELDAERLGVD